MTVEYQPRRGGWFRHDLDGISAGAEYGACAGISTALSPSFRALALHAHDGNGRIFLVAVVVADVDFVAVARGDFSIVILAALFPVRRNAVADFEVFGLNV